MNNGNGTEWVKARRRAMIPLDDRFRVSRSLRARVRSARFTIRFDTAFSHVIRACAAPTAGRPATWLDRDIITIFDDLHRAGHAHSVEAWLLGPSGDELVGGLYGLALGGAFCGESMFSRPDHGGTDASKVCLVALVEHLRRRGFTLLDAQLISPHIEQFGAYEVSAQEYRRMLDSAATLPVLWS